MRRTDTRIVSKDHHVVIPITTGIRTSELRTKHAILLGRGVIIISRTNASTINTIHAIGRIVSSKQLLITSNNKGITLIHHSKTLSGASVGISSHIAISSSVEFTLTLIPTRSSTSLILRRIPSIAFTSVNNLSRRVRHVHSTIRVPFLRHRLFRHCSLGPPGNILLCKPPNGKGALVTGTITGTLTRNTTNNHNIFLSIGKPRLLGGFINRSRHLVHVVFGHTHRHTTSNGPIVIFVSRVSSLLHAHKSNISSSIRAAVIPRFLTRLSNIRALNGIVIVNTSGHVSVVSPTILHPNHLSIGVHIRHPGTTRTTRVVHRCLASSLPLIPKISTGTLVKILIDSVCSASRRQCLYSIYSRRKR